MWSTALQTDRKDPHCFKLDMDSIKTLLPLYCQAAPVTVNINSQRGATAYHNLATSARIPTPHSDPVGSFVQPQYSLRSFISATYRVCIK
jgi:hypothetical protein